MAPLAETFGTSYDLTTGVIVDMDEAIYLTSPLDSPFLTGVGADGLSVISSKPTNEKKVEWMHDAILTPRGNLAAASITTGQTAVTLAAADAFKFSAGDLLYVDSETMRITSIAADGVTLVVVRGLSGTTATHVTSSVVIGVGHNLTEGSDPGDARMTDRTQDDNLTQIFGPEKIALSGTEQVIAKYGVANEFTHQLFQRTQEVTIRREQAILYGRKFDDTSGARRAMGGLFYYITTNVSSATQLNVTTIQAQQQLCWAAGGQPDRIAVNPVALSDLNDAANTSRVRMDIVDSRRGRVPTMEVYTEFGPLTMVRNRWLRTADAVLFKRDQVVRRPLRPFVMERLAKTGDADSVQILCEESLEVKGQVHMSVFNALAYT